MSEYPFEMFLIVFMIGSIVTGNYYYLKKQEILKEKYVNYKILFRLMLNIICSDIVLI